MESLETQVLDDNEGLPTQLPKANTDISHQDAKVNPIWNLFPIGEYGWVHQRFFHRDINVSAQKGTHNATKLVK